jgi:hypothetical protein
MIEAHPVVKKGYRYRYSYRFFKKSVIVIVKNMYFCPHLSSLVYDVSI